MPSLSLLPSGSFDLLIYTEKDSEVPLEWCVVAGRRERKKRGERGWSGGAPVLATLGPRPLTPGPPPTSSPTPTPPRPPREDSDARLIEDAENVRLRSFSTRVHRVDTAVSYRADGAGADLC